MVPGTPLPGKWSGMGHPVIREVLPPPERPACKAVEQHAVADPEASRDLEDEGDRFRKRFWTEDRRKRTQLRKRAEIRKKWIGRQFGMKKRSESFTTEDQEVF